MNPLIDAILTDVRIFYGLPSNLPVPEELRVMIEMRIKGMIASQFNIVPGEMVVGQIEARLTIARINDHQNGLTAKNLNTIIKNSK